MKFLILTTLLITLFSTSVLSVDFDSDKADQFLNSALQKSPIIGAIAGSDKINIVVTENNETSTTIGIETKDGNITNIKSSAIDNPSLEIKMTQEALTKILSNPKEITNMLSDGSIKIEPKNPFLWIKMFIILLILRVVSFFSVASPSGRILSSL